MNFGRFQPRVDLDINPHELPVALQIVDALAECTVTHEERIQDSGCGMQGLTTNALLVFFPCSQHPAS